MLCSKRTIERNGTLSRLYHKNNKVKTGGSKQFSANYESKSKEIHHCCFLCNEFGVPGLKYE